IQPQLAKSIIQIVDNADVEADLVVPLRDRNKKRQAIAESIAALNYALDHLVRLEAPAAAIAHTESKIAYVEASRAWVSASAMERLHALHCSLLPVVEKDPSAVLQLDQNSLCAKFVQKLSELELSASELVSELEAARKYARELGGN